MDKVNELMEVILGERDLEIEHSVNVANATVLAGLLTAGLILGIVIGVLIAKRL